MKNDDFVPLIVFLGLGICPLFFGLYFLWITGQNTQVSCTRLETNHINCQIDRAFLGRIPSETISIEKVTGTDMTTTCDEGSCTYAINLLTDTEIVQLTNLSTSNLDSVEAEKEQLDYFLADTEAQSLDYNSGPTWLGMGISFIFTIVGGFMTLLGIRSLLTLVLKQTTPS